MILKFDLDWFECSGGLTDDISTLMTGMRSLQFILETFVALESKRNAYFKFINPNKLHYKINFK